MLKGKFVISFSLVAAVFSLLYHSLCPLLCVYCVIQNNKTITGIIEPPQTGDLKFCIVKINKMLFIAWFPGPSYISEGTCYYRFVKYRCGVLCKLLNLQTLLWQQCTAFIERKKG